MVLLCLSPARVIYLDWAAKSDNVLLSNSPYMFTENVLFKFINLLLSMCLSYMYNNNIIIFGVIKRC